VLVQTERGEPVRNLVEVTFMSLNGVMDAPKLVEEAVPYFQNDQEHSSYAEKLLFAADALLLGRKTYEVFAEAYPNMAKSSPPGMHTFIDRMNSIPKYVASRTLTKAMWNASIIKGDVADEVLRLKQKPGKDILKYGTGSLDQVLLGHDLIDIIHVYVYPFLFGSGKRFLEDNQTVKHLKLQETTTFGNGTVILTYSCRD
jgi:dihydrofolate reductase